MPYLLETKNLLDQKGFTSLLFHQYRCLMNVDLEDNITILPHLKRLILLGLCNPILIQGFQIRISTYFFSNYIILTYK